MANAAVWAIVLIALVVLLEGGGNFRGLFVLLAGGAAVAIEIIAAIVKLGD